jgi:2-keto-3-deoxy-L-rhamnonate aldolase RhmA
MTKADGLREKIRRNELVVGGHVFSGDQQFTELMGHYGYDFVWIDAEHSALDLREILGHVTACAAADTASFVRVAWNDPVRI